MMRPLEGRTILDCSTLLPGPFLGKLLVRLGARVIKIENPDRPDPARANGAFYEELNELKEEELLDILGQQGRRKFESLVKSADGLIEGFRPNAKKKLGLDEITLHRINPKLCIASLVGYPEDSPLRDRAGHDLNIQALSGSLSLFNEMPALPLADLFCAFNGALSLVAAIDAVHRGSPGSRIEVSMSESIALVQGTLIREYQLSKVIPQPLKGLFGGEFPCYRIYKAGDGRRIAVGAIEPKFWLKLCDTLGLAELDGFAVGEDGERVIAEIQSAFAAKPWSHWAPHFAAADCCVEPVLDYSEIY